MKDNCLYILGGNSASPLSSFDKYSYERHSLNYQKMPAMSKERDELGSCLGFDGHIYAAGGVNSNNGVMNSFERFNFNKMKWETLPNMRFQRRSFVLLALPNGIYAIGGHDGKKCLSEAEFFDY